MFGRVPPCPEFLVNFIQIYQNEPPLWQVSLKEYYENNRKEAVHAKILRKLKKKVDAKVTKDDLIKIINNIMNALRKEN